MPRPDVTVGASYLVAAAAGAGSAVAYAVDAGPQVQGGLLALAFAAAALALGGWAARLMPDEPVEEPREGWRSDTGVAGDVRRRDAAIGRRRLLGRLAGLAGAAVGAAVLVPLGSLGPRPGRKLLETAWRPGARLVGLDGRPVVLGDLAVGAFQAVFPEGHVGSADAQVVLVRVSAAQPEADAAGATVGYLAYSRLCTHMGCPVGLYEQEANVLLCPCHQSAFAVLDGGVPVGGPAVRPLPRLPLGVADDGVLVAAGELQGVAGPGFWRRP